MSNAALFSAAKTSPGGGPSASAFSRAFTTRRAGLPILLAALLTIAGPQSLPAQRAPAAFATRTTSAQAVLHITALIVPSVMAPQPTVERPSNRDFSLRLPTQQIEMEVTSEWRTLPDKPDAALKTTTVVSR